MTSLGGYQNAFRKRCCVKLPHAYKIASCLAPTIPLLRPNAGSKTLNPSPTSRQRYGKSCCGATPKYYWPIPLSGKCTSHLNSSRTAYAPFSRYETFPPVEARRILQRLEFHYTPKHGSWLNMAEIEIAIEAYPLFSDFGETIDTRINELIKLVIARARKFGDDSSFVSRLEPVPGVRRDRVLVSRMQFDLVKDCVVWFAAFRYTRLDSLTRLAFYVEPDLAPTAAKRLLLARIGLAERRMAMLCAGLTGYHDKLFSAVSIIVDINDELQTCALQFAQAKVNHLDLHLFLRCQHNTSLSQCLRHPLLHLSYLILS